MSRNVSGVQGFENGKGKCTQGDICDYKSATEVGINKRSPFETFLTKFFDFA